MDPLWKKILIVALWVAFSAWYVRPVPGKGLPIGRGFFRGYLNARQAIIWGGVLVGAGMLVALAGLGAEENDVVLFAFFVGWLGGVYLYQGIRMKSPRGHGGADDLADPLRKRP